ncbi:ROK family protein, partial [uncultured Clostridium sp.]|uniref:ROK family protein n=1 Tax=uncultured Clostridium sp. TaxID=59620 RepID=UPI002619D0C8
MRYLGIDVGGTNIKYGVFSEFGVEDILRSGEVRTITDDLDGFINLIGDIINKFENIDGVGLSIPCAVNSKSGLVVEEGGVPVLDGLNIKEILHERLGIKIAVENDANCCALAEQWIGNGKGVENFICITIGTGVGGGIIINNKLLTGNRFFAGEFGRMILKVDKGDIEDYKNTGYYCSTSSLVRQVAKVLRVETESLNGKIIFEMIKKENQDVINVYEKWVKQLSIAIANLGFIFDPEKILIGGGVSNASKVIDDIKKYVDSIDIYDSQWEINN